MLVDRALMFVHMGMEVEDQWEKAVDALRNMSNLEIALTWRRLSSRAPVDDFRVHSEYKCLFKRAVREAEGRSARHVHDDGLKTAVGGTWEDSISLLNFGSDCLEYPRMSRHNSAFSSTSSVGCLPVYSQEEKAEHERRLLEVIANGGVGKDLSTATIEGQNILFI